MELQLRGRRAYAATGGRGFDRDLPTIAFLHGAGMDHTVWALQTRWFAHHGRNVVAFDLPGHGRSEGPSLGSLPEMAAWLLEALAALGADRARLVGHSMGALVALAAAAGATSASPRSRFSA
jgi:pimeloyl-ACP methyl ester carboxylesterase